MFDGYDIFEYTGSGHSTVLNRLLSENIYLIRAKSSKNKLIIYTKSCDRQKIVVLFDGLCYNYKIIKSKGLSVIFNFLKKRWILPVGALLIIIMLCLIPAFLFSFDISCDGIPEREVWDILQENGIRRGTLTAKIDCNALQLAVSKIEGVAFADIEVSGSTLIVRIQSELPPVNIIDYSSDKVLSSRYDAVITRQLVFSGTAAHNPGDIVRRGETLINGHYVIGDEKVDVDAIGEVYGIVNYTSSIMFFGTRVDRVKSGNSFTETVLDFLWLQGKSKGSPYDMYERKIERVTTGFLLPMSIQKITYYEVVDVEINETFEQARDRLISEALSSAQKAVPAGAVIKNRQTKIREVGGNVVVEAVISAEHRLDIVADDI